MVTIESQQKRLSDNETQNAKLTVDFAKLRSEHLKLLAPLEEEIRRQAPLPISYDIGRSQPPYFNEFTYTELLGGLYVSPQSCEAAARMVQEAVDCQDPILADVMDFIPLRDKYKLDEKPLASPPNVVFLPGTNIFRIAVSKENLSRLMHEQEDIMLKLHPLTDEGLTRFLGMNFGYHRLIGGRVSGAAVLSASQRVWVTTSTEMGLYAMLEGKPVGNITNYAYEPRGSYNPFYRVLWNATNKRRAIRQVLNSPLSGFFHPEDPHVREKIGKYFEHAMSWRAAYKPLVEEYSRMEWNQLMVNRFQEHLPKDKHAVPKGNERSPSNQVADIDLRAEETPSE